MCVSGFDDRNVDYRADLVIDSTDQKEDEQKAEWPGELKSKNSNLRKLKKSRPW